LKVSRRAAVVGGGLGVLLAVWFSTVIDALSIFYSLLSVSLFVPVVAGLHVRRVGAPEALAAIGTGVSVLLAAHLHTGGEGYGPWTPTLIGLLIAGATFALLNWCQTRNV
jgi:SSS family solute:Na+ symporter